MRNTIKITNEAKEQLDWLKSSFSFSNFSITIETMGLFFKNNKVNPRELLTENYSQALFNLKQEIINNFDKLIKVDNDNSERIIKLNRRFELDYLKPMNVKLIDIHKYSIEDYNNKSNEKVISNLTKDTENINELNKIISNLKNELEMKNNDAIKLKSDLLEYHRCLKTLNENMKVKGGVPFINLSIKDAEDLFYLIP